MSNDDTKRPGESDEQNNETEALAIPVLDTPADDPADNSAEKVKKDAADSDTAATKSEPVENAPAIAAAPAQKKGNGVAWFALLIALLAAGASGYITWMYTQQSEELRSLQSMADGHHQQSQSLDKTLKANQASTASALAQRASEHQALAQELRDANAIIEGHSRRLLSLTATTTDDWRLAEVEYLLRLANQRILTSKDGQSALNLLRASDQILLELGDPRLFSVRESIANDRAALAIVAQHDTEGVFLQLAALSGLIDDLPLLVVPEFSNDNDVEQGEGAESSTGWQQQLRGIAESTWRELKSLIVIQARNADIKPLLPPEQQYYLRNNLRLLINQAQLALLDGRQAAYSESLANAEQWLQDYFPTEESAVTAVISELQQLQKLQIEVELPDVSNSLIAIKAFIADQHRISNGDVKDSSSADDDEADSAASQQATAPTADAGSSEAVL